MQATGMASTPPPSSDKMGKKVYIFYTDYAMGQSDVAPVQDRAREDRREVVGVAGAPLDTRTSAPVRRHQQAVPTCCSFAFARTDSLRLTYLPGRISSRWPHEKVAFTFGCGRARPPDSGRIYFGSTSPSLPRGYRPASA